MRIRDSRALPGLAPDISVPLIPGLFRLAAGQPAARGCAPDRCPAARSRPRPLDSLPQPADGEPPAADPAPARAVRPAAMTKGGTR